MCSPPSRVVARDTAWQYRPTYSLLSPPHPTLPSQSVTSLPTLLIVPLYCPLASRRRQSRVTVGPSACPAELCGTLLSHLLFFSPLLHFSHLFTRRPHPYPNGVLTRGNILSVDE